MYINTRNLLGHTTGVQRYTSKIIDYLSLSNNEVTCLQPLQEVSGVRGHIWEQYYLPKMIKNKKCLWSPSNTGPLMIKNQVVTIHDTVPFDHPEWLNSKFVSWYHFLQPKLAKRVAHIITISEFSKDRIIHYFKVPEKKISVVYNGVDLKKETNENDVQFDNFQSGYLLTVGSLEPRKNIVRLIEAFKLVKRDSPSDLKLVIVGKKGVSRVFGDDNSANIKESKDIIFTGHVSDDELIWLYKNASGFCYPSMYEGFGLPPLEAMSYGLPVLTSNNTSMEELCKNKSILVDPYSIESIANGLVELQKLNKNSELVKRGFAFSAELTWNKCAEQTAKILNNYEV